MLFAASAIVEPLWSTEHFDEKTGEIVDGHKLCLDEEAIAEAERYDGYYLIVTSETGWDAGP